MFCIFVGCLPGITGYHRVSPGITGYHSTRFFFALRACGAPLTRPGGGPRLAPPPAHDYRSQNQINHLLIATHFKNIELLKPRHDIDLNLMPRSFLTVATEYRLNCIQLFRISNVLPYLASSYFVLRCLQCLV